MTENLLLSPQYLKNLPRYLRHADFIDGEVDRVSRYVTRFHAERATALAKDGRSIGEVLFQARLERLENNNFCDPILSTWLAFLCQEVTVIGIDENEQLQEIAENMDGFGKSAKLFLRDLFWQYLGFGVAGVLVEAPAAVAETQAEAQAAGERSYSTLFAAHEILNIKRVTDFGPYRGEISELLLLESVEQKEGEKGTRMRVRRFWTEQGANGRRYASARYLQKEAQNPLDTATGLTPPKVLIEKYGKPLEFEQIEPPMFGSFDRIPFVLVGEGPGESVLKDVVPKNRAHLNKSSARDSINFAQAFKRVAASGVEPHEIETWSEHIMALFQNENAKIHEIEPGNPTALTEDLQEIERNAVLIGLMRYHLRHQLMSGQTSSAESKKADNKTLEEMLTYYADNGVRAMNDVFAWHYRFELGAEPEPGAIGIQLNRDWGISDTPEDVQEQQMIFSWAEDFAEAGFKLKQEMLCAKVSKLRLIPSDKKAEEEKKRELIEQIRAQAYEKPRSPFTFNTSPKPIADMMAGTSTDADEEESQDTDRSDAAQRSN